MKFAFKMFTEYLHPFVPRKMLSNRITKDPTGHTWSISCSTTCRLIPPQRMLRVPGLGMHNALPCPLALSTAQAKAFDIFCQLTEFR